MRACDPDLVVRALNLRTVVEANWASGLEQAAVVGVFVTPAVGGWVFATGRDALPRAGHEAGLVGALLRRLGAACGEAFWFATHDRNEYHGWGCARGEVLLRGFAYDGEAPAIFWDEGAVTAAESELGFFAPDPRDSSDDPIAWWPTERDVLLLAAAWSSVPTAIAGHGGPGVGRLGRL